jgi:hypothetical protein
MLTASCDPEKDTSTLLHLAQYLIEIITQGETLRSAIQRGSSRPTQEAFPDPKRHTSCCMRRSVVSRLIKLSLNCLGCETGKELSLFCQVGRQHETSS